MITVSAAPPLPSPPESDKGLRAESVGLFTMISLGLASVAPAYSLTVRLGLVVAIVGVHAPAALLVGFVPILCTSFAYREQNRVLTVNEEAKDRSRTPGRAAVISTLVLLGTYVFTAVAAISFAGAGTGGAGLANPANAADVLTALAGPVLGSAAAKLVTFAICISAISALLTCVVSNARPNVSVSAHGAQPAIFGRVHPRYQTPTFSTIFAGGAAAVLLVALTFASSRFLGDAILSTSLLIAFYYGATALSCTWYFRGELRNSVRDLLIKGVLPFAGGTMMLAAFGYSVYQTYNPDYGSTSIDGVGGVFLLGIGSIVLGLLVIAVLRIYFPDFFRHGRTTITELIIED